MTADSEESKDRRRSRRTAGKPDRRQDKIAQIDAPLQRRTSEVTLGMPVFVPFTGRTTSAIPVEVTGYADDSAVRQDVGMAESERQARVIALLEDNVRTELEVVNGMLDLGLSDAAIERLMEGVTSGVLYAFDIDWAPNWVKSDQVHTWQEAVGWFGRCPQCLMDSPPSTSREEASAWVRDHESSH
ncbi:hypothetical protein ACIRG5_03050 [Lentzea sp. NPDC102401]|uniref:hypothetical protein n=1 Tax=Lentzea sp. NPDC102401 TaxID=3364128 RepID=UPI003830F7BB